MSFSFSHATTAKAELTDFASLKESILAAAKEAAENDRRDSICIDIMGGWHYLDRPFVLSTKENPELSHLAITVRGKDGDTRRSTASAASSFPSSSLLRESPTSSISSKRERTEATLTSTISF